MYQECLVEGQKELVCDFLGPSSLTFICLPAACMREEEVDLRPPLASCAASAGFISLSLSVLVF